MGFFRTQAPPPSRIDKAPGPAASAPPPSITEGGPGMANQPAGGTTSSSGGGPTGGGGGGGSSGGSGGWADRLQQSALAAEQQAASQAIADQYTDAGYAADLANGIDATGGPTPTSQPSSISRLADTSQWGPMAGTQTPAQAAGVNGMAGAGPDVPYVTVPVDHVVVAPSGSAQIRPLFQSAKRPSYRDARQGVPMVPRSAALPTPPAGNPNAHPSQGGG